MIKLMTKLAAFAVYEVRIGLTRSRATRFRLRCDLDRVLAR